MQKTDLFLCVRSRFISTIAFDIRHILLTAVERANECDCLCLSVCLYVFFVETQRGFSFSPMIETKVHLWLLRMSTNPTDANECISLVHLAHRRPSISMLISHDSNRLCTHGV